VFSIISLILQLVARSVKQVIGHFRGVAGNKWLTVFRGWFYNRDMEVFSDLIPVGRFAMPHRLPGMPIHAGATGSTHSRLRQLLAERNAQLDAWKRPRLKLEDISEQTGVDIRTLKKWDEDTLINYHGGVIATLCAYFHCRIQDLLEIQTDTAKVKPVRSESEESAEDEQGQWLAVQVG
jgi:DNA-binding Xre family transcriptional regulator